MKHIYVSPHSDDVALSCGGQILADDGKKQETMVVNVFTSDVRQAQGDVRLDGGGFAGSIHADRTSEDKAAWDHAGIRADYADLPEALLRREFPFAIVPRASDRATMDRLYEVLTGYTRSYPEAVLHVPAGIGSHVDHLLCRNVAFRMLDDRVVDRIRLYEDIPYSWLRSVRTATYRGLLRGVTLDEASASVVFRSDGLGMPAYLARKMVPFPKGKALFAIVSASLRLGNLVGRSSNAEPPYRATAALVELDDAAMKRKKQLLYLYESQIPMLFGDRPDAMLEAYRAVFSREVSIEITRAGAAS